MNSGRYLPPGYPFNPPSPLVKCRVITDSVQGTDMVNERCQKSGPECECSRGFLRLRKPKGQLQPDAPEVHVVHDRQGVEALFCWRCCPHCSEERKSREAQRLANEGQRRRDEQQRADDHRQKLIADELAAKRNQRLQAWAMTSLTVQGSQNLEGFLLEFDACIKALAEPLSLDYSVGDADPTVITLRRHGHKEDGDHVAIAMPKVDGDFIDVATYDGRFKTKSVRRYAMRDSRPAYCPSSEQYAAECDNQRNFRRCFPAPTDLLGPKRG